VSEFKNKMHQKIKEVNDFRFSQRPNWRRVALHATIALAILVISFYLIVKIPSGNARPVAYFTVIAPWALALCYLVIIFGFRKNKG
jgi:uncharacterized membrane protein